MRRNHSQQMTVHCVPWFHETRIPQGFMRFECQVAFMIDVVVTPEAVAFQNPESLFAYSISRKNGLSCEYDDREQYPVACKTFHSVVFVCFRNRSRKRSMYHRQRS